MPSIESWESEEYGSFKFIAYPMEIEQQSSCSYWKNIFRSIFKGKHVKMISFQQLIQGLKKATILVFYCKLKPFR